MRTSKWGWWAGPNEEEYTYGGPFATREEAIDAGHGYDGEPFFICEAKTDLDDGGPDPDYLIPFVASRNIEQVQCDPEDE